MKSISLKKLSLFTLSLLTLCCMGAANEAQAGEPATETPSLRSKSSSVNGFQRTEAIVESTNIINTFVLRFPAAVRAPTGSQEQIDLVRRLQETLTKNFSLTFIIGGVTSTATDFDSLLALVQSESTVTTFDTALSGNLSLERFCKNRLGRRTVQMQGLHYSVQTLLSGQSVFFPALDQWTVVETMDRGFKIKKLILRVLTTPIPFGTPI
jgi:hypothetical protein